jgi:hypothetical protein
MAPATKAKKVSFGRPTSYKLTPQAGKENAPPKMKVIEPVEAEEDDSFGGELDWPVLDPSKLSIRHVGGRAVEGRFFRQASF